MTARPAFAPRLAATLLLAAALAGPSVPAFAQTPAGPIAVESPWSRATPPGARTGAGYLRVVNSGAEADRLLSAASSRVPAVEIHQMRIDEGVMTMRELEEGLEIPANGTAELAPGGLHLMLVGLETPLGEGERVPLTLRFERAGEVETELVVEPMRARGPSGAEDRQNGGHGPAGGHDAHAGH